MPPLTMAANTGRLTRMGIESDTIHRYETPEGPMFVRVRSAQFERDGDTMGRVYVTSDPSAEWSGEPGYLAIRGRHYRVRSEYKRRPAHWSEVQGWDGKPVLWHSLGCNRLRITGASVDWSSATGRKLAEIEVGVLTRFEADHPDWQEYSVRLAREEQEEKLIREVRRAQRELAEAEAALEQHRQEYGALV